MSREWSKRLALVVPIEDEKRASKASASMSGNSKDREGFFTVRLSATGEEPATHLGASTALRGRNVNSLSAIKQQFPGGDYLVADAGVTPRTQFHQLLDQMGLQVIRSPDDGIDI